MKITRTSMTSGNLNTMDIDVTFAQYQSWIDGENIQVAMPHISADEREFIKTGMTPTEWNELFGEDTDDNDFEEIQESNTTFIDINDTGGKW